MTTNSLIGQLFETNDYVLIDDGFWAKYNDGELTLSMYKVTNYPDGEYQLLFTAKSETLSEKVEELYDFLDKYLRTLLEEDLDENGTPYTVT